MSSISSTITTTVQLGGAYGTALLIDTSGAVEPTASFADGIVVPSGVSHASISNHGTILAGAGGIGILAEAATAIGNTGLIEGGMAAQSGTTQVTGIGVSLHSGSRLTNSGTILGAPNPSNSFPLGTGVIISAGANVANLASGVIEGNEGVDVSGGTLANAGTIAGDAAGITLSGGLITNTGVISGDGSNLVTGGTLVNGGILESAYGSGGVVISNATIIEAGQIYGGVHFGGIDEVIGLPAIYADGHAKVVILPGAQLSGALDANSKTSNTLIFGATRAATYGPPKSTSHETFEGSFLNFSTIDFAAGSHWTLQGAFQSAAAPAIAVSGALTIKASIQDAGTLTVEKSAGVNLSGGGAAAFKAVDLFGGVVSVLGGSLEIGTLASGAPAHSILIDKGGLLETKGPGQGAIRAAEGVIDNGTISLAASSNWVIGGGVSGTGLITGGGNGFVALAGPVSGVHIDFAQGEHLGFDDPAAVTATLTNFTSFDFIDLNGIAATSLSFMNNTLTVDNGTITVATLNLDGNYSSQLFSLTSFSNGVEITYGLAAGARMALPPHDAPLSWHV